MKLRAAVLWAVGSCLSGGAVDAECTFGLPQPLVMEDATCPANQPCWGQSCGYVVVRQIRDSGGGLVLDWYSWPAGLSSCIDNLINTEPNPCVFLAEEGYARRTEAPAFGRCAPAGGGQPGADCNTSSRTCAKVSYFLTEALCMQTDPEAFPRYADVEIVTCGCNPNQLPPPGGGLAAVVDSEPTW